MEQKYRLEIIGITYNQIESGVYALILQQCGTNRRIPIIIGYPEAQAIECKLQEIKTPRPLTHDMMSAMLKEYGIKLQYVLIKRMPNGVFAADLHFTDGTNDKIVDSRSSDGVALALRENAPIYATEEVIREASFDPSEKRRPSLANAINPPIQPQKQPASPYENKTIEQLTEAMNKAAEKEDYEEAARLKDEINRRQNPQTI